MDPIVCASELRRIGEKVVDSKNKLLKNHLEEFAKIFDELNYMIENQSNILIELPCTFFGFWIPNFEWREKSDKINKGMQSHDARKMFIILLCRNESKLLRK